MDQPVVVSSEDKLEIGPDLLRRPADLVGLDGIDGRRLPGHLIHDSGSRAKRERIKKTRGSKANLGFEATGNRGGKDQPVLTCRRNCLPSTRREQSSSSLFAILRWSRRRRERASRAREKWGRSGGGRGWVKEEGEVAGTRRVRLATRGKTASILWKLICV